MWAGQSGSGGTGRASGGRSRAAVALFAALLTACSFEYSDADASPTQLLGHIPETELTEVTHTIVRNGRVAAEFRARQVRNFPRAGCTELDAVHYSEYDRNGILMTAGNADRAVYYTEREDAELAGAIRLRTSRSCAGRSTVARKGTCRVCARQWPHASAHGPELPKPAAALAANRRPADPPIPTALTIPSR